MQKFLTSYLSLFMPTEKGFNPEHPTGSRAPALEVEKPPQALSWLRDFLLPAPSAARNGNVPGPQTDGRKEGDLGKLNAKSITQAELLS